MAIVKSEFSPLNIPEKINCTDWLLEKSRDCPHKIALVNAETKEEFSYGDVRNLVSYVSHQLRSRHRHSKGDVICIYAPNSPETAIIMLAILKIGAIFTGVNPVYTPDELERQLNDSGATYIYTHAELLPKVGLAKKVLKRIIVRGSAPGCISLASMLEEGRRNHIPYLEENEIDGRNTTAILPYSSGTTGLPKGVILSHYNIIANLMQINNPEASLFCPGGVRLVGFTPFFHVSGLVLSLLSTLATKGTLVVMSAFDYIRFLQLNMDYKATWMLVVPPVLLRISKDPNLHKFDLSCLRGVGVGAAPTSPGVMREASEKLNVNITQGWGMSETTCVGSFFPAGREYIHASVGKITANTEAKIVDEETGAILELKKTGELCIRGPQVMQAYWRRPTQTSETIDKDGWLHTGDIAYIDEGGCIFIVDRLKELIKFKGFQVAPAEIESVLLSCSEIVDAAVVGVQRPDAGEVPRAYVVLREGYHLTTMQIQKYVQDRVAPYKCLRGGVEFVGEIPKSPSGKILRRQLKAQANNTKSKL